MLQARRRRDDEPAPASQIRIGYTASKKVGGAVQRNRAKRRLRAVAEPALASLGTPGWDYVLIARAGETALRPFATLETEFREALQRAHNDTGGGKRKPRGPRREPG